MSDKYQRLLEKIRQIKGFDTLDEAEDWYGTQKGIRFDNYLKSGGDLTKPDWDEISSLIKNTNSNKKAIKAKRTV